MAASVLASVHITRVRGPCSRVLVHTSREHGP